MMGPRQLIVSSMLAISFVTAPARAEETSVDRIERLSSPAGGIELWSSMDSDNTDVVKLMGRGLWKLEDAAHYGGLAIEKVWFRPQGEKVRKLERVYVDLADDVRGNWFWRVRAGFDGHTGVGSASIRASDWSKEFFLERELVETPRGVDEKLYHTFVGASLDLLRSERDVVSATAGLQAFTGKNERLHLRASYIHVIKPKLGLSLQLRGRYYHSTQPGEFDYYSPRHFGQLTPVIQIRRFDKSGWMYRAAVGFGVQKASGGGWQQARLLDLQIESPASSRTRTFAQVQYTNDSLRNASSGYSYLMARAGFAAPF